MQGPTPAEAKHVAFDLLRPIIHLLRVSGISESVVRSQSEQAYRLYGRAAPRCMWLEIDRFAQMTNALAVWSRDPDFIDDAGSPRRLPLERGPGSFAQLLRRAGVSAGAREALGYLESLGSVRRCDRGRRVRLVSSALRSRAGSKLLVAPTLDALRRFAETAEHSLTARPSETEDRWLRRASSARVDPRRIPEIQRFVRTLGEVFMEAVEEKLLACARPHPRELRGGRLYRVGVHVYTEAGARPRRRRLGRSARRR